MENTVR
jgi:hypothetical protein